MREHNVRYEVHPYHVELDQRPVGAPPICRRVQAGFDVDLIGTLDKMQLPLSHIEGARMFVNYFEKVAQEIQSKAGQQCTVEVIPCPDSLILDIHQHLQPQAMLRIRISHNRGLDQPEGPSEEQALKVLQETLHGLKIRQI